MPARSAPFSMIACARPRKKVVDHQNGQFTFTYRDGTEKTASLEECEKYEYVKYQYIQSKQDAEGLLKKKFPHTLFYRLYDRKTGEDKGITHRRDFNW